MRSASWAASTGLGVAPKEPWLSGVYVESNAKYFSRNCLPKGVVGVPDMIITVGSSMGYKERLCAAIYVDVWLLFYWLVFLLFFFLIIEYKKEVGVIYTDDNIQ